MRAIPVLCVFALLLPACGPAVDPATVDPKVLGPKVYTNRCLPCHGATGQGLAGLYPPLANAPLLQGEPDTAIRVLLHGLQGPLEFNGQQFNSPMPSWSSLHDAEISAVLTFARSRWGNTAGPVTMEQVAKLRARYKGRSQAWTLEQLKHEK